MLLSAWQRQQQQQQQQQRTSTSNPASQQHGSAVEQLRGLRLEAAAQSGSGGDHGSSHLLDQVLAVPDAAAAVVAGELTAHGVVSSCSGSSSSSGGSARAFGHSTTEFSLYWSAQGEG
jgi:hypothetical protein